MYIKCVIIEIKIIGSLSAEKCGDRAGENPLGATKTQSESQYETSIIADKYGHSSDEVGGPDLIVCVHNAQGLLIVASPCKNNAGIDETINLTVPVMEQEGRLSNIVPRKFHYNDGALRPGLTVKAFDRNAGIEDTLPGHAASDSHVQYSIASKQTINHLEVEP